MPKIDLALEKYLMNRPGMMAHTCNPVTQRLRQKDHKLEANQGNLALFQNKKGWKYSSVIEYPWVPIPSIVKRKKKMNEWMELKRLKKQ